MLLTWQAFRKKVDVNTVSLSSGASETSFAQPSLDR